MLLQSNQVSPSVRITDNEDGNVLRTVTGSASQLRGSELL